MLNAHDRGYADGTRETSEQERDGRDSDLAPETIFRGVRRLEPLPDPSTLDSSLSDTLDEHERILIVRALSAAGGNVAEASRRLKTDRANLYRRMRRLGIPVGDE